MKLSELSPEQKTRLLAELDGWTGVQYNSAEKGFQKMIGIHPANQSRQYELCKPYLTSYDAIIPLIQKLDDCAKVRVEDCLESIMQTCYWFDATPSQLCDAALVATGKAEL